MILLQKMWQQNREDRHPPQPPTKTTIKIIGKYPFSQTQPINPTTQFYPSFRIQPDMGLYCPELQSKPEHYHPTPKKIYAQGNLIAIIDCTYLQIFVEFDNLWFVCDLFPVHVNVTSMLYRRVRSLYLSQNQCILNHRKNPILLNWGAKKILDVCNCQLLKLNEKNNKHVTNYFTAYSLENSNKQDKYYYSNTKKADNSNKLYQLKLQVKVEQEKVVKGSRRGNGQRRKEKKASVVPEEHIYSIVAYPTQQSFVMRNKVVGISVGKFHCMCWDSFGLLYTWGNRSLALGYEELPRQKITTKPRIVQKLNKFVTMGFAGTHYSLALTSQGNLYEWGIKNDENQLNEQLIFEPKILKVDEKQSKIIMLKGKQDLFTCLNSRHELFVWGQKAAKYLHQQTQLQYQFKNGHIYQPFQIPHLEQCNVVDFCIGEFFIAVLICNNHTFMASDEEKQYWTGMLKKVKSKLKMPNTVKTQATDTVKDQVLFQQYRNSECEGLAIEKLELVETLAEFKSNVEKSYEERNLKKQYFRSLKNQDKFYLNLMKNNRENTLMDKQQQNFNDTTRNREHSPSRFAFSQRNKDQFKISLSASKNLDKECERNIKVLTMIDSLKKKSTIYDKAGLKMSQKRQSNLFLKTLQEESKRSQQKYKLSLQKFSRQNRRDDQKKKLNIESYQVRLQRVQQRKKSLQQSFCQQISKKVEQNSIQYRSLRHQQLLQAKVHQKNRNLLKHTLQSFLIKHYIVKMIISPIQQARKIKIEQFGKSLHLSRIEKNLRMIFVRARVKHRLAKLRKCNFIVYALLCHVFKRYVKWRRQQKTKAMRKLIAQQLYKNILREKIRFGLSKTHLNTRKLQKFREWLFITKIQRLRCLRIMWKNHLLSIMKVTNDPDAIILCKPQQNCTFESLYKQKIIANPMLKLETFLNKSPIFQLRSEYFQSIIFLFRKDNRAKSQKMLKSIKNRKKQKNIKFSGQNELSVNGTQSSSLNDLLPYSLHYNLVVRPKSMQINIPESMKKNQNWVKQQIHIFEKCLNQILEAHQKNYLKARRKYDIDLAYFIREKYDSLAQKRWKYIIEYNQIKHTPYKAKRQKQLYRIFDLIGMKKILNEDCLPEKYLMLDEAIKKRDAPVAPSSFVMFGIAEFKEAFKKYYEIISAKAKYLRKTFV